MRVLVTGGAGYIGSVVCQLLLDRGAEVVVLDNLSTGHREAVPRGCRLVKGDVGDRSAVAAALRQGADAVMHFAALSLVADSVKQPLVYFANNVSQTVALLEELKDRGVGKFIFSSSAAVYGNPSSLPIEEDEPCSPQNPYGHTKLAVEAALEACRRAWGLSYASLRYFNAAGGTATHGEDHRPESHLLPRVIDVALGREEKLIIFGADYETPDGTCVRDYIHVEDLAEAHLLALSALERGSVGVLNLGSDKPHSVLEVIRGVEAVTGRKVPFEVGPRRPGDPPALLASSRRAQKILGWRRRHSSLEEIVSSAFRWRLAHPDGYRA